MEKHQNLLSNMQDICPNIAYDLLTFWNKPITDYAAHIGKSNHSFSSKISIHSRKLLFKHITRHALKIYPNIDQALLEKKLAENPVFQSSLHSHLYMDNMNFNGMLLGLMSALLNNNPFYFIFNSSLVTLLQSGKIGPAWINCTNTSVKIIDLPNSRLKDYSLCCIQDNIIKMEDYKNHDLHEHEVNGLQKIVGNIDKNNACNLSSAFAQLNSAMIKSICGNYHVEPIIIDDRFFADLIIDHIHDETSFIHELLFDSKKLAKFNNLLTIHQNTKFGNFLADGTELFWGIGNKKIKSLKLSDGILFSKNHEISISFNKEDIIHSLQKGYILPNMFLCYLCLAILPNIQVQGGTRMIVYLPLFKKIVTELLDTGKENEQQLYFDLTKGHNFTWGARVIESTQPPIKLLGSLPNKYEFDQLLEFYSTKTLQEASQDLIVFKDHPRWKIALET